MLINIFTNVIKLLSKYYDLLLQGLGITLLLSLITVACGAIIGLIVCFMTMSKSKILNFIGTTYVEIIRGVPLLLQLLLMYFIVPTTVTKFIAVSIALFINSGAYVAEIFRAGIQAVDNGQTEAGRSLGLNRFQTMTKIVLPQAIKNILPAIGNEYVTIIKETSLASNLYLGELMTMQQKLGTATYLYLESYIVVAIFYFISTFTLSKVIKGIERRMKISD